MQKLQCELCGSIDILRTDDGFFQCQHCGCKYTLEQAKSLLGIVAETTIGDTELNRRVENAKAQIKIGQPAEETIESIIKDFPASPKGYLVFFENYFEKILKDQTINCTMLEYFDNSKYDSLYAIAKDSTEITTDDLDKFFNNYFTKIYNGLINGEITGRAISCRTNAPNQLIKNAAEIGVKNAELLTKYKVGRYSNNGFNILAYGLGERYYGISKIDFCLGKEWHEIYKIPVKPLILTESNIGEVVQFAKKLTQKVIIDNGICLRCGSKVKKALIGNAYKCTSDHCDAVYKLSDLM